LQNLKLSTTYYDIRFSNRIQPGYQDIQNVDDALNSEAILGPTIVQRNVSPDRIQALLSSPAFFDAGLGAGPTSIVVDYRSQNVATVVTRGVDLSAAYVQELPFGNLDYGIDATRIIKFSSQATPTASTVDILNTAYNPVDWKGTARATLAVGSFRLATFVNYVNSYEDTRASVVRPVSSWTTIDLNASYHFDVSGVMNNCDIAVGARNLMDRDPPFVQGDQFKRLNFDGNNANALGRFVYLQLSKRL
jgi:iron complex outermembrane receptor protein